MRVLSMEEMLAVSGGGHKKSKACGAGKGKGGKGKGGKGHGGKGGKGKGHKAKRC